MSAYTSELSKKYVSVVTNEGLKAFLNTLFNAPFAYSMLWCASDAARDIFVYVFPASIAQYTTIEDENATFIRKAVASFLRPFEVPYLLTYRAIEQTPRAARDVRATISALFICTTLPLSGGFFSSRYIISTFYGALLWTGAHCNAVSSDMCLLKDGKEKQGDGSLVDIESENNSPCDDHIVDIPESGKVTVTGRPAFLYSVGALCFWTVGSLGAMQLMHSQAHLQSNWYTWTSNILRGTSDWLSVLESPLNWVSPVLGLPPLGTPLSKASSSISSAYQSTEVPAKVVILAPSMSLIAGIVAYVTTSR